MKDAATVQHPFVLFGGRKMIKGFLITGFPKNIGGITYHGVDTEAWPIGPLFQSQNAKMIYEESFFGLPLLIDLDSAMQYCRDCVKEGKNFRLLYCEVLTDGMDTPDSERCCPADKVFLGYDYSYSSGDYYSALLNDVIWGETCLSVKWKKHLNGYGLFSSEEMLQGFIEDRQALLKDGQSEMAFELGDFAAFRLFSVDDSVVSE